LLLGKLCSRTTWDWPSLCWCEQTAPSDERLKEDNCHLDESPSGIPVYTFKYRKGISSILEDSVDTKSTYFGVLAQDLLDIAPDALVMKPDGHYRVDYSKIDVDLQKLF
jgi:hypothetical protein